jgi:hypothetical protein
MPATIRQPDPLCAYQDAWVGSKNPPRKKRSAGHNHSAGQGELHCDYFDK